MPTSEVLLSARSLKPTSVMMALAMASSWGSMLAHNLYELPLAPLDLENSGPLVVAAGLLGTYCMASHARSVAMAILGWALLNLVIGGIVTVLPLPVLPFEPEQSVGHYLAHVGYSLGQVPLTLLALSAIRQGSSARKFLEVAETPEADGGSSR